MGNDMKHIFLKNAISVAVAGAALNSAVAGTNAVPKIERLALFKNGLGYATATVTLPDTATSVRLGQLPVPSYGTFWVGYPKEVKVLSLTTAMETVDELFPAMSVDQLLRLNPGRKVVLHTSGGTGSEPGVIEGVVQPQPATPTAPEPPSPYFMDVRRTPERPYYYGYPSAPQNGLLLVKTDKGMVALTPGAVQRVEFAGAEPLCVTTNQQKRPSIRMELERPAGGQKVSVSYLARGITWVPSYRIDLSDEKSAVFSAQAQIINEMTDIEAAHVDLVTGFPNIQFAELPNPVAMSQTLAEFLKSLAAGRAEGGERGYMVQQQALANIVQWLRQRATANVFHCGHWADSGRFVPVSVAEGFVEEGSHGNYPAVHNRDAVPPLVHLEDRRSTRRGRFTPTRGRQERGGGVAHLPAGQCGEDAADDGGGRVCEGQSVCRTGHLLLHRGRRGGVHPDQSRAECAGGAGRG